MVAELLKKYIWLIDRFINAGDRGMSLVELQEAWENRWDAEYSRRTFNNHREAIGELFGIEIRCNRSSNRYFIPSEDNVDDYESNIAWLIDTFTVNSILSQSKDRLQGRISVEEIPSGRKYLAPLMNAMQEMNVVEIRYAKYGENNEERIRVHPYAIRESSRRWYLVGFAEHRNSLRVYGLDRIKGMDVLHDKFTMPEKFDIDELYATSYGSFLSSSKSRRIQFKAFGKQASYIRDLPLHHTQEIVEEGKDSTVFSIMVSPNEELYNDFMKFGADIEVLSPEEVRDEMRSRTGKACSLYKNPQ